MVEKLKCEVDFKIEYHYKENGGRHTALNMSYQYIDTEFVLNIDSDDELICDAIEKLLKIIGIVHKRRKKV